MKLEGQTVFCGLPFPVRLPESGSTGYIWHVRELGDGIECGESTVEPCEAGTAGVRQFALRARELGRRRVTFELRRPWESVAIDEAVLEVDVLV